MLELFKRKPRPEEAVGPDGMTDYSREMHRVWARRDAAMEKIEVAMAQHGLDRELLNSLPYDYAVIALLLGVKLGE